VDPWPEQRRRLRRTGGGTLGPCRVVRHRCPWSQRQHFRRVLRDPPPVGRSRGWDEHCDGRLQFLKTAGTLTPPQAW